MAIHDRVDTILTSKKERMERIAEQALLDKKRRQEELDARSPKKGTEKIIQTKMAKKKEQAQAHPKAHDAEYFEQKYKNELQERQRKLQ